MRTLLLTSVAAFGLALAAPAMAQDTGVPTPAPHKLMREGAMNPATGARWGHTPGIGVSLPVANQASNIAPQDTRSIIAPTLPKPPLAENATPAQFLAAARDSLARGQTGAAQEALERAMTRRLDRDALRGIDPSGDPMIGKIRASLDALASHQLQTAQQDISSAMPATAENEGLGMGNSAMNMTGVGGPTAPDPDTGVYQAERHHTAIPGNQGQMAPPGSEMNPNGSRY